MQEIVHEANNAGEWSKESKIRHGENLQMIPMLNLYVINHLSLYNYNPTKSNYITFPQNVTHKLIHL